MKVVSDIEGISFVYFDERDVVRHKLVQQIVKAYEAFSNGGDRCARATRDRRAVIMTHEPDDPTPSGDPRVRVAVCDERGRPIRAGLSRWLDAHRAGSRARRRSTSRSSATHGPRAQPAVSRQVDRATDVLSFPAGATHGRSHRAGSSLVSATSSSPGAWRAVRRGRPAMPRATEITVLALHGLLHLLGYDHERDRGAMARARASAPAQGRPARGADRTPMIPLVIFLLACVGDLSRAASARRSRVLMRLSLRLHGRAQRSSRLARRVSRRSDPAVRAGPPAARSRHGGGDDADWRSRSASTACAACSRSSWAAAPHSSALFELLLPLLIVGRDPERVLELLLPTFSPIARALGAADRTGCRA